MTEEEKKALLEQAKAEAKAEAAKEFEAVKQNLVGEITDLRQKKQEVEAERDVLKQKLTPETKPEVDVQSEVRKVLDAEKAEQVKTNRTTAEMRFKGANKALFDESNDPGGLKWAAFQQKLARINLEGNKTVEDFIGAFEDALVLMNKPQPTQQESHFNPYATSPSDTAPAVDATNPSKLSAKEKQAIQMAGITEEKFLQLKKSKPGYVASLLAMIPGN